MADTPSARPRSLRARVADPDYVDLVFALVFVWGFGDLVSTLLAVHATGVETEANPWIRVLLAHEPLLVVALKAAVALYVGVVLLACRPVVERVPGWRTWFGTVVGLGCGVVALNLVVAVLA
ncbi:DUF5658 family protein [Haloarcula litorea]|uniref:DUF5658 family protein n=1 Tax=Haloarcula litorea TaxID=3032579 RepID=UPI0023E8B989|nr:DUF5658 family protein [Halomicroarcula sp. GDY20]